MAAYRYRNKATSASQGLKRMATPATPQRGPLKFIDIGANITDGTYRGRYHGKPHHEADLPRVISRAREYGVEKMIITGCSLRDSRDAVEIAKTDDDLFCTVGCHPTRSNEFEARNEDPDRYLHKLIELANKNKGKVVAAGEMGLDFDRLQFSSKGVQMKYFEKQMELVKATNLPVFFHCRVAYPEFYSIIRRHRDSIPGGVVHSFTGTKEEALEAIDMGFYVGINGCSMKTQENIDVMCALPSDKLMIETDCPYCDIRPTHAGFRYIETRFQYSSKEKYDPDCLVKSRNEPCTTIQVLEVMSGARGEDKHELADIMYQNTMDLFFKGLGKGV